LQTNHAMFTFKNDRSCRVCFQSWPMMPCSPSIATNCFMIGISFVTIHLIDVGECLIHSKQVDTKTCRREW
jgi:hypothetical protein